MGDHFNRSGDFRAAIVNIRSTLTNVVPYVHEIRTEDGVARRELTQLLAHGSDVLQQGPASRREQAEAVAQTTKVLVETAISEKPNKTLLQIGGQGLKPAAKDLSHGSPAVIKRGG